MSSWRAGRAAELSWCAIALMGGVVVHAKYAHTQWDALLCLAPIAYGIFRFRLGVIILIAFALGVIRADATDFARSPLGQRVGSKVTVSGTIIDDPSIEDSGQVAFTLGSVALSGQQTHQKLRIYCLYGTYERGFIVQATGKVKKGKGSVPAYISYADIQVISDHQSAIERLRQRMFAGARSVLPDPLSGFGLGLLIGVRGLVSQQMQATLNAVGLSHLIAVSGYNLTIIIEASRRLLGKLSTYLSTMISLWMIGLFLLITGFGASIVRATLVSMLGLLTSYFGYEMSPWSLLAVPAILTVVWNPNYVLSDVGWQLSFLAFFGIMVLAPLIEARFIRRPNAVTGVIVESSAAQVTTTPLIMIIFGNLSVVAPLANAIILPLVPLAMLLSFATAIAAAVAPSAGGLIAQPAVGLLGLMIGLIQSISHLPSANLQVGLSLPQLGCCYFGIALLTTALWRSNKRIVEN